MRREAFFFSLTRRYYNPTIRWMSQSQSHLDTSSASYNPLYACIWCSYFSLEADECIKLLSHKSNETTIMTSPPDNNRTKMRQSILLHPTKNEAALPLFDDEETITPVIFDRVTLWGREEFQNSEVSANELHDLRALSEGCRYSNPQLWMKEDSMGYSGFHRLCNMQWPS